MTWDQVHRRHQLVQAVLTGVGETGEPAIPPGLRPRVDAEFGGFEGFLREVQLRWYRAFDAHLDALLEDVPGDMRDALIRLERDLATSRPADRLLLDAHADHPALAVLHDQHRRRLYAATGVDLVMVPAAGLSNRSPAPNRVRRPAPRHYCGLVLARLL